MDMLDFDSLILEFYKPDLKKFPMLNLAWEALGKGGFYPCAYNSANEAAVDAFLCGRAGFLDIPAITGYVLESDWRGECESLEAVLNAHAAAGKKAAEYIGRK
jgi:1-deoxy-D-xylulose-5-phosphate reductoisomerase